jgi:hypothetical protein
LVKELILFWAWCSGSVTFWYGFGSADPYLWITDTDPALFFCGFRDANKTKSVSHKFLLITSRRFIYISSYKFLRSYKTVYPDPEHCCY